MQWDDETLIHQLAAAAAAVAVVVPPSRPPVLVGQVVLGQEISHIVKIWNFSSFFEKFGVCELKMITANDVVMEMSLDACIYGGVRGRCYLTFKSKKKQKKKIKLNKKLKAMPNF